MTGANSKNSQAASEPKTDRPKPVYFLRRGEGKYTPLIPVDELPDWIIIDQVPKYVGDAELLTRRGITVRPPTGFEEPIVFNVEVEDDDEENSAGDIAKKNERLAKELGLGGAPDSNVVPSNLLKDSRIQAAMAQVARAKGSLPRGTQVYNPTTPGVLGQKVFCTHWMRTGECDFTQQGCMFVHRMPDLDTLEQLGFRTYPRWFREMPRDYQEKWSKDFNADFLKSNADKSESKKKRSGRRGGRGKSSQKGGSQAPSTAGGRRGKQPVKSSQNQGGSQNNNGNGNKGKKEQAKKEKSPTFQHPPVHPLIAAQQEQSRPEPRSGSEAVNTPTESSPSDPRPTAPFGQHYVEICRPMSTMPTPAFQSPAFPPTERMSSPSVVSSLGSPLLDITQQSHWNPPNSFAPFPMAASPVSEHYPQFEALTPAIAQPRPRFQPPEPSPFRPGPPFGFGMFPDVPRHPRRFQNPQFVPSRQFDFGNIDQQRATPTPGPFPLPPRPQGPLPTGPIHVQPSLQAVVQPPVENVPKSQEHETDARLAQAVDRLVKLD